MSRHQSSSPVLPSGYTLGDFRIESTLGRTDLGVAYLAFDTVREVKAVVHEHFPQDAAVRGSRQQVESKSGGDGAAYKELLGYFIEEAGALEGLDHPNVAKVQHHFAALGTAYYVEDYVQGSPLGKWVEEHGLPERGALAAMLRGMLSALGYLHSHELGPWDIRPGSFIIKEDATPVLVDFSVLRRLIGGSVDLARTSPSYAAIELSLPDGEVGPWTDFYALAATLCQVLSGSLPPDSAERAKKDKFKPLCRHTALVERYGEPLLACIDKALEMEPDKRWQTAEEWIAALDAIPAPVEAPAAKKEEPEPVPATPAPEERPAAPEGKPAPPEEPAADNPATPVKEGPRAPFKPLEAFKKLKAVQYLKARLAGRMPLAVGCVLGVLGIALVLFADRKGDKAPAAPVRTAQTPAPAQPAPAMPSVTDSIWQVSPSGNAQEEPVAEDPVEPVDLAQAVMDGKADLVKKALEQGATPRRLYEVLGQAAARGNAEIVALLLDHGADADATYKGEYTALGFAVCYNHVETVKLLLERGANPDAVFENGTTALTIAAYDGLPEIMLALLDKKADVKAADVNGDNALMIAAYAGHADAVKLLLDHGADAKAENKKGVRALDYAKSRNANASPEGKKAVTDLLVGKK